MKRFKAMAKEIGWLWAVLFTINTVLAFVASPLYWFTLPILITICIYFTLMRYDQEGKPRN